MSDSIRSRIAKLLRLSRCRAASAGEAAAALDRALALAKASGVDLGAIDTSQAVDDLVTDEAVRCSKSSTLEERLAAAVVCNFFGVRALFDSRQEPAMARFIGLPAHAGGAATTWVWLVANMRAAWRTIKDRRLRRPAFLDGYQMAVWVALSERPVQTTALVVAGLERYEAGLLRGAATIKRRSRDLRGRADRSWRRGYRAGSRDMDRQQLPG